MGAVLDALQRLQDVERQIAALRRQADTRARQVQLLTRQIEAHAEQVKLKEAEHRAKQMEFDRIELDTKSHAASIAKHREALNRSKTNKEYAAILTAINTERADSAKFENRQMELLGELERLRQEITDLGTQQVEQRRRLAEAATQVQTFMRDTASERERLTQLRGEVADLIPPSARATFERVAERHEGEAMAELIRLHPKREEYACGGCHMTLTREVVNSLKSRDEIQTCGSCGSILHLSKELVGRP